MRQSLAWRILLQVNSVLSHERERKTPPSSHSKTSFRCQSHSLCSSDSQYWPLEGVKVFLAMK